MKFAVLPNFTRRKAAEVTAALASQLTSLGAGLLFDEELRGILPEVEGAEFCRAEELIAACDTVVAVGGDGSVIKAAKTASPFGKNVIGVNAGKLAYLCELDADELPLFAEIIKGNYSVRKRMMLHVELLSEGRTLYKDECLNDIVFSRGNEIKLTDICVSANGKQISDYIADGVIFNTPTGSTAYSLSAGGPVIDPGSDVISLVPVCPHSLTCRPFIFGGDTQFEVVRGKREDTADIYFSCDGSPSQILPENAKMFIERSHTEVSFISLKSDNFIDVLNKKL